MENKESPLRALLLSYAERANAGDLEGWLALWCDDGVQMPEAAPARTGVDAIREAMAPVFADLHLNVEIHAVRVAEAEADIGFTHCDYSISATPKSGGDAFDVMRDGKALTVYRRQQNGSWKIAYDCVNSNLG